MPSATPGTRRQSQGKVWAPGHWPGGQSCISKEGEVEASWGKRRMTNSQALKLPKRALAPSGAPCPETSLPNALSGSHCPSQTLGPKFLDGSDSLLWPPSWKSRNESGTSGLITFTFPRPAINGYQTVCATHGFRPS